MDESQLEQFKLQKDITVMSKWSKLQICRNKLLSHFTGCNKRVMYKEGINVVLIFTSYHQHFHKTSEPSNCHGLITWKVALTYWTLPVTWRINSLIFDNCTFCPHCIYVFCIYLRTNSGLCHLQHKLIGFYNRDEKCLLSGTNWVFK